MRATFSGRMPQLKSSSSRDGALLNKEDAVRGVALGEDDLAPPVDGHGDAAVCPGEKCLASNFAFAFLATTDFPFGLAPTLSPASCAATVPARVIHRPGA
jgi:hypothetical protein